MDAQERSRGFQWISVIYLLLFALAVFSPSLIQHQFFGLAEQHLEEALIFIFGLTGIIIFMLYERLMERNERNREEMADICERAKRDLVSSYQYIGTLNRRIEVLKRISNDTSVSIYEQATLSKDLLQELAVSASGSMGGGPAMLRFVHLPKLRTEREFLHASDLPSGTVFSISNKALKRLHEERRPYGSLIEEAFSWIAVPSDRMSGDVKAFLIVKHPGNELDVFDPSVLKVFANQAELVYRALRKQDWQEGKTVLDFVEAATDKVVGDVE